MAGHALIAMTPIGVVTGGRLTDSKDYWGDNRCVIDIDPSWPEDMLQGLEQHSHLEVVFYFHHQANEPISTEARHPRNNTQWPKAGIFAQRARMRPNRIGISHCKLLKREQHRLFVEALDAIDGTPVLDIKPVWHENQTLEPIRQPEWSHQLMSHYWENKQEVDL